MKYVENFPKYRVDTNGNIINNKGHKLKPELTNSGYLRVSLSNDKIKHKHLSVHRLVAEAYIPNPNNYTQVNHKDENKLNNCVDNLEWCSPLQNLKYSGVIDKASVAKYQKVMCLDTGEIFESIKDACDKYGLYHSNIVACCNGRRSKAGGLSWTYHK